MNVDNLSNDAVVFLSNVNEDKPLIDKSKRYNPTIKLLTLTGLLSIILVAFLVLNIDNSSSLYKNCIIYNCTYLSLGKNNYLIFDQDRPLCESKLDSAKNNTPCYINGYSNCPKYPSCYNQVNQIVLIVLNIILFVFFLVIISVYWCLISKK